MVRRLLLVLAIVSALAVVAPTVAAADQGGTNRPYMATQTTINTITGGSLPGPLTFVATGTSIDTDLGKSSLVQNGTITFLVPFVPCAPGTSALFNFTATGTITAANGDQLFTSTSGTTCAVMSGIGTGSGTGTFVGGTGRFADASGSFTFTTTLDSTVSPTRSETRLVGTISY